MKEVIQTLASELSIQEDNGTCHEVSSELKELFYQELRSHAMRFLQDARQGKSIKYSYGARPNRNLSEVLQELPKPTKGSFYCFPFHAKVRFKVKERDEYYFQVKSTASQKIRQKCLDTFGRM